MEGGYASKNNIDEYNQYFSNIVSTVQHTTFDNGTLDTERIMG
jgi:hypothetical protein